MSGGNYRIDRLFHAPPRACPVLLLKRYRNTVWAVVFFFVGSHSGVAHTASGIRNANNAVQQ